VPGVSVLAAALGPGGPGGPFGHRHGVSLLQGWLPVAVQVVAALVLLAALGPRPRRWLLRWAAPLVACGVAAAYLTYRYVYTDGLSDDPAPAGLWVWIGLAAAAVALVVAGWRGAGWPWPRARRPRRALSVLAVPLSLICVGLMVNMWVGYFPTTTEAWAQVTAGPLPDETPASALPALAGTGAGLRTGRLVPVTIPATASHFAHRTEYVYLPPAWFTPARPALPVVLMLSGEFNTPADWVRVGNAVTTLDGYAAAHRGQAPVVAFVDTGGSFNNDTECVDGPRGNVATYLTRDVPGYLESTFHTAAAPAQWGLVGWSAGGTCAVDLAVTHPELFGSFVDIAGDLGPNTGDKARTIATLYGGDAAAWARYDPLTVLSAHAPYAGTAGWFFTSTGGGPGGHRPPGGFGRHHGGPGHGGPGRPPGFGGRGASGTAGFGGRPDGGDAPQTEVQAARQLCAAATAKGVTCSQHTLPGGHSWQFAGTAFARSLPWLETRFGAPAPPAAPAPATAVATPPGLAPVAAHPVVAH
jgi:S-formylglutathione hydrolase FrmB